MTSPIQNDPSQLAYIPSGVLGSVGAAAPTTTPSSAGSPQNAVTDGYSATSGTQQSQSSAAPLPGDAAQSNSGDMGQAVATALVAFLTEFEGQVGQSQQQGKSKHGGRSEHDGKSGGAHHAQSEAPTTATDDSVDDLNDPNDPEGQTAFEMAQGVTPDSASSNPQAQQILSSGSQVLGQAMPSFKVNQYPS